MTARTTNPQLTGFTYFNSTNNAIATESIDFDSNIFNITLPGFGADTANYSVALKGKKRITNLQGIFTGTNAEIAAFRSEIESAQDDILQADAVYTAADGATYNVLIATSSFRRDLSFPEQTTYTITLLTTNQLFD